MDRQATARSPGQGVLTALPYLTALAVVMAIGTLIHSGPLDPASPGMWLSIAAWPAVLALRIAAFILGAFLWAAVPCLLLAAWLGRRNIPIFSIGCTSAAIALLYWLA